MKRYNANGGQRRSRKIKLAIPNGQTGFSQFVLSLIKIKNQFGRDVALRALEKYNDKYRIEKTELHFLKGIIKGGDE